MSKYFVSRNDSVSGPFTEEQVKARLASSEIAATDLVWGAGMNAWQNAKTWTVAPSLGPVARPAPAPKVIAVEPVRTEPKAEPVVMAAVKPQPKPEDETVVMAKPAAEPVAKPAAGPVAKPAPKPAAETETVFIAAKPAPKPEAETVIAKPRSEAETIFMAAAANPNKPKQAEAETVFIGKPVRADDETVMMTPKDRNEPAVDIGEATRIIDGPANELWHFAIGGKSHGPFKRVELVEQLRNVDSVGEVMLWTKGMKEWAHLFEFHEILSAIGVNKRQFPRADLPGQALIKVGSRTLTAPTLTISEGGMGVKMDSGLEPGQPVTVEIQSPAFNGPIVVKADVRYIFDGVLGLKFTQIQPEAKAAVAQLVRKTTAQFVLKAG